MTLGSCETLHEFTCGAKLINTKNKPSMYRDEELKPYTDEKTITTDYDNPEFLKYMGMLRRDLLQKDNTLL